MSSRKHLSLKPQATRPGFTMVELMLAMAFVAFLLISIATITSNIAAIYQKGLTLKAVNSVGRGLIDELTSSINSAPSVDTTSLCNDLVDAGHRSECISDHAFGYIYHSKVDPSTKKQLSGIFCTGNYSYVWNTYYGIEADNTIKLKYRTGTAAAPVTVTIPDGDEPPIRLLKVKDSTYRVCSSVMNNNYTSNFDTIDTIDIQTMAHNTTIYNYTSEEPQQGMLSEFDLDLALYELTIFPISQDAVTLRTYMSGTFILATLRGNVDIMRSGDYCQPDRVIDSVTGNVIEGDSSSLNSLSSEFNYCAINKFNFAARTAGV